MRKISPLLIAALAGVIIVTFALLAGISRTPDAEPVTAGEIADPTATATATPPTVEQPTPQDADDSATATAVAASEQGLTEAPETTDVPDGWVPSGPPPASPQVAPTDFVFMPPTPAPTPTEFVFIVPTATPAPTVPPIPIPTATPAPVPTPTTPPTPVAPTPVPTTRPTPRPTTTPTAGPRISQPSVPTPTPTATPTPSPTPTPTPTATPTPTPTPTPLPTATPTPEPPSPREHDPWEGVRQCESNGYYGAINPNDTDGTPSYGAYQFKQGTWNWVVNYGGRPELHGIRPDFAAPADQDWAAEVLRTMPGGGLGHWPNCGQYYG